jgi:diguanylate cyclase (GGDEF)-like protein/PAS domain S-box-containing protein
MGEHTRFLKDAGTRAPEVSLSLTGHRAGVPQASPTSDGSTAARLVLASGWRSMLDKIPQMLWTMAANDGSHYYNDGWLDFTGIDLDLRKDISRIDLVHPDDRARALGVWERSLAGGTPYECQYRLLHKSGEYRWVLSRALAERDETQKVARWYGSCTDIHEQITTREALEVSTDFGLGIVEASPDCVSLLDLAGVVIFVNEAARRAYGPGQEVLVGRRWGQQFMPSARAKANAALAAAARGEISNFQLTAHDGRCWDVVVAPVRDQKANVTNLAVISRDISRQKSAEEKIRWAANHDSLTEVANRSLLQQELDTAIAEASASDGHCALLLLDVDDFKRTNDTLGHDAGDALLCAIAQRLKRAVRPDDTVARLGGDEFAIVLKGVGSVVDVQSTVASILGAFSEPCLFEGRQLECQASMGASIYPAHGNNRTEILKNADVALYAAKAAGRGTLMVFQSEMRLELQRRASMLSVARNTLDHDRIVPFYQPKIDLHTGSIVGFEALLRWRHPREGIQAPDTLAAAFDDIRLARELSRRMIQMVIRDLHVWRKKGIHVDHVAINASAAEFRGDDYAEVLLELMAEAAIPVSAIQLEVTETVFLGRGAESVLRALEKLSEAGMQLALDDFGTGYASLSHLKQFPVNIIKIDRSFVKDMETNRNDAAIIDAVIGLGKSLGLLVIAEGVETSAQHLSLQTLGCEQAQGFLYGKAQPGSVRLSTQGKHTAGNHP